MCQGWENIGEPLQVQGVPTQVLAIRLAVMVPCMDEAANRDLQAEMPSIICDSWLEFSFRLNGLS